MIGRLYTIIDSQSETTSITFIEIQSGSSSVTLVERLQIKQTSIDTSENLGTQTQRASVTGSGQTTVPNPLQEGDGLFGGVVLTDLSVEPTYIGTPILDDGFNVLSGYLWTPANDDEVIVISPSDFLGMNLSITPSGSMDFVYSATIREIGG